MSSYMVNIFLINFIGKTFELSSAVVQIFYLANLLQSQEMSSQ